MKTLSELITELTQNLVGRVRRELRYVNLIGGWKVGKVAWGWDVRGDRILGPGPDGAEYRHRD